LKLETEAGTQTRLFRFGAAPASAAESSWQGTSVAQWEMAGGGRGRGRGGPQGGTLKVVTTRMRPGYLLKNGVPYGANAVLTEYFTRATEPNGDTWLFVTHVVDDPQYLTGPFIRSTHYKKLPETPPPTWTPDACSAR